MSGTGSDAPMGTSQDGGPDGDTPSGRGQPPKNKACPFCNELFTSSSLGRHLDLYIKEKNPKPPDGVHDVPTIRQLRGTITRRQPKRTFTERQSGAGARAASTPTRAHAAAPPAATAPSAKATPVNGTGYRTPIFHRPGWEASGVMTDIPQKELDDSAAPMARQSGAPPAAMRQPPGRDVTVLRRKLAAEGARLRATELALQELVDSVNAAKYVL